MRPPQRIPGWTWLVWLAGPFLIVVASGKLAETDGGMVGLGALGVALSWVGQALVVRQHNRRVSSEVTRP
ncbi:hypothetical protein SAMN04515665_11110 [Blastococcus sp. DSM 46786]|uniref:hypothetical protein n=1 Tax=Blastococcus sp. DSM 46786 TaxID=1798227 RepID=UPI0008C32BD8|nr:hypothetical protein [Blastococcus sp. DSM 46786]SEL31087.1 hypothetical protein SAMN04515665_11110 [Blastococcus sp. DSM 46786]